MTINIRPAEKDDAESLVKLNDEFNGVGITVTHVTESIKNSNELIAIAEYDDSIVGFACAQSYASFCYNYLQGEITEMYVMEAFRRKGIAKNLIAFLEERLKLQDVKTVKILTGISNEPAKRLYQASGYVTKSEVVMQKKL